MKYKQQKHQDNQYNFPYHWLPQFFSDGAFSVGRYYPWGIEYLTYMDMVANLIKKEKPSNLLDIGCGDGRLSDFVRFEGCKYTGVDLSKKAITIASVLNEDVEFINNDIRTIERKFDVISLVEVIEHLPDDEIEGFLYSVVSLLNNYGKVIVSVPTTNLPLNKKHFRHYDIDLLKRQLECVGLKIESVNYSFKLCFFSSVLRRIVTNRIYTLNPSIVTKAIWCIHKKMGYFAKEENAAHIVVVAQKS